MFLYLPFLTVCSYVLIRVVEASATAKAPTICPAGLGFSLSTGASLGSGLAPEACANLGGCIYNNGECVRSPIPSLDHLAGDWQNTSEVYNYPSVEGFWGSIATTANLLSFTDGTLPPLSQGGESAILTVNGEIASSSSSRWYPYQVVRNALVGGLNMTSTVRMGFEKNLVMLQLRIDNLANSSVQPELTVDLNSFWTSESGTWSWRTPRPNDFSSFATSFPDGSTFLTTNSQSTTSTVFSWAVEPQLLNATQALDNITFSPSIPASSSLVLSMVLAVGNSSTTSTLQTAKSALSSFSDLWNETAELWSQRYQQVFTPNNTFFSGSLPVLVTEDEQVSALWYQSVVAILSTMRTNLAFPRVYSTVGPDEGTTIVYAWDTSLWAGLLVLLDPAFLKEQISLFLKYGVYNGYAVDYISEKLVGPWYSANDLAIFTTMLRYVNMTGDYAWLQEPAASGSTNLRELEARAANWKNLENNRFGLADYGGLSNLLEEVITYVNMVPSLNAANVWMMDQYSYLLGVTNNQTGAATYENMAKNLSETVLSVYAGPGTGYWLTTYPNGSQQAVKHVYDFDTLSLYFNQYLNSSIKSDMLSFLHDELYTGYWLRALSLSDLAANVSMRPDHGSNGAYTSWPALAAAGASQLGDYNAMMTYLRSFSSVLSESTWAQCYQLIDPLGPKAASAAEAAAEWAERVGDFSGDYFGGANGTAPTGLEKKARVSLPDQGETFNENNGASFGDVVLSYVFGWNPDGSAAEVRDAGTARGDFVGRMVGVRGPGGGYYELDAGAHGVSITDMGSTPVNIS